MELMPIALDPLSLAVGFALGTFIGWAIVWLVMLTVGERDDFNLFVREPWWRRRWGRGWWGRR